MTTALHRFARSEGGALSMDWLTLVALVTAMCIGVLSTVSEGKRTASADMSYAQFGVSAQYP